MTAPSLLISPDRYKAGKLYSQLPQSGAGDFSVVRNTVANRVNDAGVLVSEAANVPRIDFGVSSCPALLVEPAATNQIRNNTNVGAVAGTPGTLPTNWVQIPAGAAGLTRQIVGIGTENGIEYIDIRLSGTATGTVYQLNFESSSQIVAATGQQWTGSFYARIISQPLPPLSYRSYISEHLAGGGELVGASQIQSITTTLQRFQQTRTLSNASTVRVNTAFLALLTNGASYDFTIRIGLPQMELGSVATSAIRTSGTIQTRNADVISLTGVSSLIGQTQGTIYAEVNLQANTAERRIISVTSGVDSQRIIIWTLGTTLFVTFNAATSINLGAFPIGTLKIAVGYTISGGSTTYSISRNGAAVTTGTSAAAPTGLAQINLGSSPGSALQLNDRIRAAAIYTSRLSNAELAQLTTP